MNASNYFEKSLLNYLFGGTAYTPPATYYFALFSASPVAADEVPVVGVELSGLGYARVAVTNNSVNFPALDRDDDTIDSIKVNGVPIQFPAATGNWAYATYWGIYDALSGGNLLVYGELTTAVKAYTNQALQVAAGALTISLA